MNILALKLGKLTRYIDNIFSNFMSFEVFNVANAFILHAKSDRYIHCNNYFV